MSFNEADYVELVGAIDDYIDVNDFETKQEYILEIIDKFSINYELAESIANVYWEDKIFEEPEIIIEDFVEPEKPKPKPKEVKLTKTQETDIKNVIQNEDLTKREVSIRTLEIVNKPFSLKQFYDETGMVQSTARRELGQAVKRGEIERVSRGVYRRL
jgi:hypothetical protein